MEIVKDSEPNNEPVGYGYIEPSGWRKRWMMAKHHIYCFYLWNIRRKFPMLVWYGDDIDICVTFTDLRIAPESVGHTNPDGSITWDIRYEGDMETIWKAESALYQLGLSFDTGTGCGRDWEWDYSLRGPVRLKFKQRHKGDRKAKEPRPPLKLIQRTDTRDDI